MRPHANDKEYDLNSGKIFVFGSNLAGFHGAGAAKFAREHCGAVMGQGFGFFGKSFAIPTKDADLQTLTIEEVQSFVTMFIGHAECHTDMQFFVTRIGCGLAGFDDKDIAPLFKGSPPNCELPHKWDKPELL